jgi:16S rRNA (cytosine1402-N4)-methyltransferase
MHVPVLLAEVLELMRFCRRVLDCTAGAGGHAVELARQGASILALDKDPHAAIAARAALEGAVVLQLDFAAAADDERVRAFAPDGILLDLGVSSPQLDDAGRGFTFRQGAPLDMRMSDAGAGAAAWLNGAGGAEMAAAFRDYADERPTRAARLAREIERRRARSPFRISDDLVGAIRAVLGPRSGPGDFARLFQAVRIAVNDELAGLEGALPRLFELLQPGGVMVVISYHSGEDRIVKRQFREWALSCVCPPEQPVCTCRGRPLATLLKRRASRASEAESAANPRSRSASLRAIRKVAL